MKYVLIIWICSLVEGNQCMAPMESPKLYNSWYECSRTAHKESLLLMTKMGYKYINDKKIALKYSCKLMPTI